MKRFLTVAVAVGAVVALAGIASAHMPWGGGYGGGWGMGPGMMYGGGGPGGAGGGFGCRGWGAAGGAVDQQGQPVSQVTPDKAKEVAQAYAKQYLPGFNVERVLPFQRRFATMYQAELKGPGGETRILHVNPWGNVMPFGGPTR